MACPSAVRLLVRSAAVLAIVLAVAAPGRAQDGVPCPAEPTNMAIAYGDVITCSIQAFSDTDTFTFTGTAGEVIVINATYVCFTLTAPGGEVRDTCGSLVAKRLDATLAESGTYTITTRLQPIGIISHSLALERVLPASPRTTAIAYGETRTDTINVAGDLDVFSFNGAIGDTVSIRATAPGNFQPCIELIAPDNTRSGACASLTSNVLLLTLMEAGTHVVLMRQGEGIPFGSAWSYTLELQCTAGACFSAPLPPAALTGMVSSLTTTLTWNAPTTGRPPTAYVIEAGTSSGATDVMTFDTGSTLTTFLAPGVPNGTYFVRVRSRNQVGTSAPSNEIAISGGGGCPLPTAPPGLAAAVNGVIVSLQWGSAGAGTTSYVLAAGSTSGASNLANVDVGLTTQFSTPAPFGTYFVRVRARNACGLGPASNEVTVVVGCTGPPGAPPSLTTAVNGSVVTLNWGGASGQPSSYVLEVGSTSGSTNLLVTDVGNQLALSANAPPGTYFVRVRARNACGISGPSIERVVIVP